MKKLLRIFSASLIAGLILILLLGYLFLFQWGGNKGTETAKTLFPEIQEQQVNSVRLKYPGHDVTIIRDGRKWLVIKDSKRFNGDDGAVGSLLNEISEMEVQKVAADNPSSLDDFGLKSPRVEVMLKTPFGEYRLSVGSETPVGLGTYVRVGGKDDVLIVDRDSLLPFLDRSENDFRDKQILALEEEKIRRVIFRSGESSFEVERQGGSWVAKQIPSYARLNQDRMGLILKAFLNLKIDNFEVDDPMNLSAYGLVKPNAEIEIFEDGDSIRVLFGEKKENGDYYVKLDSEGPVYSISEYVFVQIPESIDDIRVRKLINIDPTKVRGLEIREGDNVLSMQKDGDSWRIIDDGTARVDETKINALLNTIAVTEVETFVEDYPSNLTPYGLDRPEIRIAVTGGDGEKTTLLFGRREGKEVYAKVLGQESVYGLSDALLSKIHVYEN